MRPGGGIGIASVEGIVSSLDGMVDIVIGRRYKVEDGLICGWRDDWYSAFVRGTSLAYWDYCLAIDVLAKAERSVVHGRHCAAWRGQKMRPEARAEASRPHSKTPGPATNSPCCAHFALSKNLSAGSTHARGGLHPANQEGDTKPIGLPLLG